MEKCDTPTCCPSNKPLYRRGDFYVTRTPDGFGVFSLRFGLCVFPTNFPTEQDAINTLVVIMNHAASQAP